jgi:hypothetical protein
MVNQRPDPPRPTSIRNVALARWVAGASAVAAGAAIGAGTLPDAIAAGGASIVIPIFVVVVVVLGLSAGWHMLMGYAAHTREAHERSLALGFGSGLTIIGAACSGWFLAALIGGHGALQSHQHAFVDRLKSAYEIVAANTAVDGNIRGAVDTAAANLDTLANAEGSTGVYTGKVGCKVVCLTLRNAAAGFATKGAVLSKGERARNETLARARNAIGDAIRDIAANDTERFEQDVANAAAGINAAANQRLVVPDLGIGIDIDHARQPILRAINDVSAVVEDANSRRRPVVVPAYQPIDTKTAIITNPQPLAWIAAMVIELLPLIFLGLLLTIWRDPEEEAPAEAVAPFRPRPNLTAAE